MKRHTATTFSVLFFSAFCLGNACDEPGPSILDDGRGVPSAMGVRSQTDDPVDVDPAAEQHSQQQVGQQNQGAPGQQNQGDPTQTSTGTTAAGETCAATPDCRNGLACVGGFCMVEGELRVSMIWDAQTDLDLHMAEPNGEEVYYRNRESAAGAQFTKDGCLADRCDGASIENILYRNSPPDGTFRVWAVNYDGKAAASVRFEVSIAGRIQNFTASAPASQGGKTQVFEFSTTSSGNLELVKPTEEQWVRGPGVALAARSGDADLHEVEYRVGSTNLGSSQVKPEFGLNHDFDKLGEHHVHATGNDTEGFEVGKDSAIFVVTDAQDLLPVPSGEAVVSRRLLAKRVLELGGVSLYPVQVSGTNDGADSKHNIEDAAAGGASKRSSYGTAPGGTINLSARMLQGMYNLAQSNTFRVTSIAGGSHSGSSRHYAGTAFDVDTVNGSAVRSGSAARAFMQACRDQGATLVLGPGDAGHSSHIHCQW